MRLLSSVAPAVLDCSVARSRGYARSLRSARSPLATLWTRLRRSLTKCAPLRAESSLPHAHASGALTKCAPLRAESSLPHAHASGALTKCARLRAESSLPHAHASGALTKCAPLRAESSLPHARASGLLDELRAAPSGIL